MDSKDTRKLARSHTSQDKAFRRRKYEGHASYTICATIADEPEFRLAGYGAAHAAPRKLYDKTGYRTLGAGCAGYAEGFATERKTFTNKLH